MTFEHATVSRESLNKKISDQLRKEIQEDYAPGSQLPSEADLARKYGTSHLTLRESLATLQAEGLVDRIHGKGTFVSHIKRSNTVALVSDLDLSHPPFPYYHAKILYTLRDYFLKRNKQLKLYFGDRSPMQISGKLTCRDFIDDLKNNQIGFVVAISTHPDEEWIDFTRKNKIPTVGNISGFNYDIRLNYQGMIFNAVQMAKNLGKKKIGIISWEANSPKKGEASGYWRSLFNLAMRENNLEVKDQWIGDYVSPLINNSVWEVFFEIWKGSTDRPDAMIVPDDFLYQKLIMAIQNLNIRIPEDLVLFTLQNKNSGLMNPLPSYDFEVDPEEMGLAMAGALELMLGREIPNSPISKIISIKNPMF